MCAMTTLGEGAVMLFLRDGLETRGDCATRSICAEIVYVCTLQHGTPPLLIAAGCGNIQIIEVLMRKGAEIQAHDKVTTHLFAIISELLTTSCGL